MGKEWSTAFDRIRGRWKDLSIDTLSDDAVLKWSARKRLAQRTRTTHQEVFQIHVVCFQPPTHGVKGSLGLVIGLAVGSECAFKRG
jgi:hypothetical protein